MARYNYTELFIRFPELYHAYSKVVAHSAIYSGQLQELGLLKARMILSVGSGEGELETLIASGGNVRVEVIEPNPSYVRAWKENLIKAKIPEASVATYVETFQNWQPQNTYDLVLFIHSWYSVDLKSDCLRKAMSCVKPGGKLFLTVVGARHPAERIFRSFQNSNGRGLCSEELSAWVLQEGFEHKYVENERIIPADWLIAEDGSLTELGRNFVAFSAFCPWNEFTEAEKSKVLQVIHDSIHGNDIVLQNGCLVFESQ